MGASRSGSVRRIWPPLPIELPRLHINALVDCNPRSSEEGNSVLPVSEGAHRIYGDCGPCIVCSPIGP